MVSTDLVLFVRCNPWMSLLYRFELNWRISLGKIALSLEVRNVFNGSGGVATDGIRILPWLQPTAEAK